MTPSTLQASHFLCESCGYLLEGLPPVGACPECGRPIAKSHSDRRLGSPWQQKPGLIAIVQTNALILLHPRGCWRTVMVERQASSALLWINNAVAAALFPGIALGVISGQPHAVGVIVAIASLWFAALLTLSGIESVGIRTFSRLRQRRIDATVAGAIVGHASVGWVVGGIGGLVVSAVASLKTDLDWRIQGLAVASAVAVGLGLTVFELLTWLGVHRMKYANAPRLHQDQPITSLACD